MRAVVQRTKSSSVTVDGRLVGAIGPGLTVLLGVGEGDTAKDAVYLADKIVGLRIFHDEAGKMNCSLQDVGGSLLVVSQFTLYGDCRKGRRPGDAWGGRLRPSHPKTKIEDPLHKPKRCRTPPPAPGRNENCKITNYEITNE